MYNKKQNQKPLFAEVKLTGDDVREQSTNKECKQRDQRIPYIKLTYPNGVTLNIPSTIGIDLVERYIRMVGSINYNSQ